MKQTNFFPFPHNVLEEYKFLKMNKSSQLLYLHLCKLKNRLGDKFYRSINTLADDMKMNPNTIKKAKKELVKNLYVDIDRDYYTHNGFRSADRFHLNGYRYLDNQKDTR